MMREIVKRPEIQTGFDVLPQRWKVERSFGELAHWPRSPSRSRRKPRDHSGPRRLRRRTLHSRKPSSIPWPPPQAFQTGSKPPCG